MPSNQRLPATLTVTLVTLVGVDLANYRAYTHAPRFYLATAAGLLLGAIAVLWLRLPRVPSMPAFVGRWLGVIPTVMGAASIYVRGVLGPGPLHGLGLVAAAGVIAMAAATFARRPVLVVAGAIVCGLALRGFEFAVVPIRPVLGDMLPLVVLAVQRTLQGATPYGVYHFPWTVPLTYLPGTWLPYAPLLLAEIDPRWMNAAAELAVLGAVLFAGRHQRDKAPGSAAAVLWAAWFVAHRILRDDAATAAPVQWAALAWVAALAVEGNRFTPAVTGVAMATTLLVEPLLPFLAIAWHRRQSRSSERLSRSTSLAPLLRAIAIACAVAAILIAPWALTAPRAFFDGVVLWFNDLDRFPRTKWLENRAWAAHPGLAGAFWTLGLERWLKPIQVAFVVGLAVVFARRMETPGPRVLLGPQLVGALLAFLLFNPVIWGYLWEAAVALSLVALASCRASDPPPVAIAPPSDRGGNEEHVKARS
jgi:hypothetical protein